MPIKFADLKDKLTPAQHAEIEKRVAATLEKMTLHELRKARRATQSDVATGMAVQQSEVSRIEQRAGLRIGTLDNFVRALGGHLEMRAVFPDTSIELTVQSE